MTRLTVDRAALQAEVERRQSLPAVPAAPAAPTTPGRWTAKVFIMPSVVAEALAKLATRTIFGASHRAPVVPVESAASRRQRRVYMWKPATDAEGNPDAYGELVDLTDEHPAQAKPPKTNLH